MGQTNVDTVSRHESQEWVGTRALESWGGPDDISAGDKN